MERGNLDAAAAALAWSLPRAVAAGVRIIVPLLLEAAGLPRGGARARTSSRSSCGPPRPRSGPRSGFVNMPADERLLDARVAAVACAGSTRRRSRTPGRRAWRYTQAESVEVAMALARSVTV